MKSTITFSSGVAVTLLCLLGSCAAASQKSEPERSEPGMVFTRHPQPFTAPLGDEVFFECSLNLAAEKFVWRHRPFGSKEWILMDSGSNTGGKTSKYTVNFDDEDKAGDYRCVAFYGTSGLASDPARLTQARIQSFRDSRNVELRVPAGNNVPITCPVPYSVPEAVIQFFKDDKPIKNASLTGSKVMLIERARPSNSGNYHCEANNYLTSETFTSNYRTILKVDQNTTDLKPYFIKQPQYEYKVERGKNITLECFAIGFPIPLVTWSKLGSNLPVRNSKSPTGLVLENVQPSDRGEYDCVWTNRAGRVKSVIILTVVEPPSMLQPPQLSTFPEGGELELSCNATGFPAPIIEWLINGETLVPSKNLEIKGSSLYISVVEKKHAGIVQCVASNEYGSHSGYNYLRVNPKQHSGGGGGGGGGTKNTKSTPERRKGTTARQGGKGRRSKHGKRKDEVMIPPSQPNVTRLSESAVMVRWSVPADNQGLPIQFFKVQWRELGTAGGKSGNSKQAKWMTASQEIPSHVRSFEISDLQPEHTYRFRIAAVYSNNDNTVSPISARFHLASMKFDVNPMPTPLLLQVTAVSPTEINLRWQNTNLSAAIDGFYVYHRATTSAGDYTKTTVEGRDATNMTISHLQPDAVYEFKVQSFSTNAASEFSLIKNARTSKVVTEAPLSPVLAEDNNVNHVESARSSNMYAIIGGVLGGVILLVGLTAIGVVYRKKKSKQSRETSQDQGKPITNGRVMNGGGMTDSKINITSNPLAGLESTEDPMQPKSGQQSSMEMASFLNGQNNNATGGQTHHHLGPVHLQTPPPPLPPHHVHHHHNHHHLHHQQNNHVQGHQHPEVCANGPVLEAPTPILPPVPMPIEQPI